MGFDPTIGRPFPEIGRPVSTIGGSKFEFQTQKWGTRFGNWDPVFVIEFSIARPVSQLRARTPIAGTDLPFVGLKTQLLELVAISVFFALGGLILN